jgi:secondary thiamine-phosphate synthase enzyme
METVAAAPQTAFAASSIAIQTRYPREFVDITDQVMHRVEASGIEYGFALIASTHTTASVLVNEHEPELLKDMDRFLLEMAPPGHDYAHNGAPCGPGEQPNGHAHCQALLLNTSVTIPIVAGDLSLGRYQRIFLVELDCPRPRQVTVALMGS